MEKVWEADGELVILNDLIVQCIHMHTRMQEKDAQYLVAAP
jgi:hypothetical protein